MTRTPLGGTEEKRRQISFAIKRCWYREDGRYFWHSGFGFLFVRVVDTS